MPKKVYYSEIFFTETYYVNGVNIFDDNYREFVSKIDLDLRMDLSFSKLKSANLYLIKGRNFEFELAISKDRDFYIICYLNARTYLKSRSNQVISQVDAEKNYRELKDLALANSEFNEDYIYSNSKLFRAKLRKNDASVEVSYENLEVDDEMMLYFFENVSPENFFSWERLHGISFFESKESAIEEAKRNLGVMDVDGVDKTVAKRWVPLDKILWRFQHSSRYVFLYQLRIMLITIIFFLFIGVVIALSGFSNWKIMYLFGGTALITITISLFAMRTNGFNMFYEVTDKRVVVFDGLYHDVYYDNIDSIKAKKKMLSRKRGTIAIKKKNRFFRLKIKNIEDYNDVYNTINDFIEKRC